MLIYLASQSIPPLFLWGAGTADAPGGILLRLLTEGLFVGSPN